MTLGASIARDRVDAVALRGGSGGLRDRVLSHRVAELATALSAGLPEVIEALLDGLAADIGADYEIAGAAVTYRDASGRRAVVTGLAEGNWYEASLVSAKSAHLSLARAMSWADEFDNLLVCEVNPGYQGYSLVSAHRDRVVAATSTSLGVVGEDTLRPGIAAAWDQLDAAGVWPDAIVVIGSAAGRSGLAEMLSAEFDAPAIPGEVGAAGSAIGAALVAQPEAAVPATTERARISRNSVAVAAAASVLAGGLTIGGIHEFTDHPRSDATTRLADARATGPTSGPRHAKPEPGLPAPDSIPELPTGGPVEFRAPRHAAPDDEPGYRSDTRAARFDLLGSNPGAEPKRLVKEAPGPDAPDIQQKSVIPAPTEPIGAPDGSLLFPGESAPPPIGTPEFDAWWENHWRLTVRWMVSAMTPRD
ncbi:hypothetical protein [Nocardia vermiculata]|uniref:DUF7159 domain-containing protein n=1 Tax=Nocardia vermiculata TaxID=257274 RepID=A0A846Y549_9NOCA|nr:hypothetical protein [Nocardia vermiculata]NKY53050.1 hypothetical protein [Nocardia vermiculata]